MNWQAGQKKLLTEELAAILAIVSTASEDLVSLIREPLTRRRRGLAPNAARDTPWPLLPMMVCQAVSGQYQRAVPAAAALQLMLAAGDVFDDIEDMCISKSLSEECSTAIAANAATMLLILAERELLRLKNKGVEDAMVIRVVESLNSYYTTACIGQHLDLSLTSEAHMSEDDYFRVIRMKSASQIECACHVGAMLSTQDSALIDAFGEFGQNLGIASQITNDIRGITDGDDILQRKITLPVIFALSQTDGEARGQLACAFDRQTCSELDISQVKDLIFSSGAIYYATIKVELYRQLALKALSKASAAGAAVDRLQVFLA
jgi:geranylgeranyl pyrophosphate synthase